MGINIITIIIIAVPTAFLSLIIYFIATSSRKKVMGELIKDTKDILDSHEEDLKEISTKSANISKEGVEITARAIKQGITEEK